MEPKRYHILIQVLEKIEGAPYEESPRFPHVPAITVPCTGDSTVRDLVIQIKKDYGRLLHYDLNIYHLFDSDFAIIFEDHLVGDHFHTKLEAGSNKNLYTLKVLASASSPKDRDRQVRAGTLPFSGPAYFGDTTAEAAAIHSLELDQSLRKQDYQALQHQQRSSHKRKLSRPVQEAEGTVESVESEDVSARNEEARRSVSKRRRIGDVEDQSVTADRSGSVQFTSIQRITEGQRSVSPKTEESEEPGTAGALAVPYFTKTPPAAPLASISLHSAADDASDNLSEALRANSGDESPERSPLPEVQQTNASSNTIVDALRFPSKAKSPRPDLLDPTGQKSPTKVSRRPTRLGPAKKTASAKSASAIRPSVAVSSRRESVSHQHQPFEKGIATGQQGSPVLAQRPVESKIDTEAQKSRTAYFDNLLRIAQNMPLERIIPRSEAPTHPKQAHSERLKKALPKTSSKSQSKTTGKSLDESGKKASPFQPPVLSGSTPVDDVRLSPETPQPPVSMDSKNSKKAPSKSKSPSKSQLAFAAHSSDKSGRVASASRRSNLDDDAPVDDVRPNLGISHPARQTGPGVPKITFSKSPSRARSGSSTNTSDESSTADSTLRRSSRISEANGAKTSHMTAITFPDSSTSSVTPGKRKAPPGRRSTAAKITSAQKPAPNSQDGISKQDLANKQLQGDISSSLQMSTQRGDTQSSQLAFDTPTPYYGRRDIPDGLGIKPHLANASTGTNKTPKNVNAALFSSQRGLSSLISARERQISARQSSQMSVPTPSKPPPGKALASHKRSEAPDNDTEDESEGESEDDSSTDNDGDDKHFFDNRIRD